VKEIITAAAGSGRGTKIVPPLGVGLPYFGSLAPECYQREWVDFVEITPETLCEPRWDGARVGLDLLPEKLKRAKETCGHLPMVVHGVELSIGSAQGWNLAYLDMLDAFQAWWPFRWHSEHLGFQPTPGEHGESLETGVPMPLPPTEESVRLVSLRCGKIRERYGVPFLLENPAHYLTDLPAEPEIGDECGLMRAITARSGCLQLLDLHNVYCNSVNHHFNPFETIDRMPLDKVVEIHVAGGASHDGFWMDAHEGRVAEPVWELLEYTLPRAPNVGGIVFELLEPHARVLGVEAIGEELRRVRDIWQRTQYP